MDECACWFVHELQAIPDSEDNIEKLAYMVSKEIWVIEFILISKGPCDMIRKQRRAALD